MYVDNIIQRTLLPEMQDKAVNAVIHFLERHDAFDPIAIGIGGGEVTPLELNEVLKIQTSNLNKGTNEV
jgi:hypothetical protein